MKKMLLMALFLIMASTCFAAPDTTPLLADMPSTKTIGMFLEAPTTYVNNEKIRSIVPEKTIPMFPKTKFIVLPFDQTAMAVRTYKEDNRMVVNQYYSTPLNRSDIQKIGKELKCDYVLWVKVDNAAPRVGAGLFSVSFKTTVTADVRLLNIESMQYLISKEIVKDGSSTAVMMGVPSFENAYAEALQKALDEFIIPPAMLVTM
jgi:hypothetical protein